MTANRWGALFGVLAAVVLVAGVLLFGGAPAHDSPDQEWIDYIQEHETAVLVRAYLFVAAALSLVAFYAFGLRPRLGDSDPVDRSLAQLGMGAIVLAAGAFVGGGLVGAAAGAAHLGGTPVDPGLARTFDNFWFGFLLVGGAAPMAAVMAVVAIQTRRRRAFPQWVLWVSIVGIIGMAASLVFLPFVLLPIWLIAISVALFRSGNTATEHGPG